MVRLRKPKKPEKLLRRDVAFKQLQDTDFELLSILYRFHPLNTSQIFRLLYKYSKKTGEPVKSAHYCRARLRKLTNELGYIEAGRITHWNKVFDYHYFLTQRGLEAVLRNIEGCNELPGKVVHASRLKVEERLIPHELLVNEIFTHLYDCRLPFDFKWITDRELNFGRKGIFTPDAAIEVGDTVFFLEVDRNTEQGGSLTKKINYYPSFVERYRLQVGNTNKKIHIIFLVEDKDYRNNETYNRVRKIREKGNEILSMYIADSDINFSAGAFSEMLHYLTESLLPQAVAPQLDVVMTNIRQAFEANAIEFGHRVRFLENEELSIDSDCARVGMFYERQVNEQFYGCHVFIESFMGSLKDLYRVRMLRDFVDKWRSANPNNPVYVLIVAQNSDDIGYVVRIMGNKSYWLFMLYQDLGKAISEHIYEPVMDQLSSNVIVKKADVMARLFDNGELV
jgi:hypothetical protein